MMGPAISWEKGGRRGGALVAPQLTSYVANELGKEAAILREKRKAREARMSAKGDPKGGKAAVPKAAAAST